MGQYKDSLEELLSYVRGSCYGPRAAPLADAWLTAGANFLYVSYIYRQTKYRTRFLALTCFPFPEVYKPLEREN